VLKAADFLQSGGSIQRGGSEIYGGGLILCMADGRSSPPDEGGVRGGGRQPAGDVAEPGARQLKTGGKYSGRGQRAEYGRQRWARRHGRTRRRR
jgi:hypothetical protein